MYGIFLLDSQRLGGSLGDRPLAVHWIASGPVIQQLVNSWEGLVTAAEVWVPARALELIEQLLGEMPLVLPVKIQSYDHTAGFPTGLLLERAAQLPAGGVVLGTDVAIVMPGPFEPPSDCDCVAFGHSAVWLAGAKVLAKRIGTQMMGWSTWLEQLDPEKEHAPGQYVSLIGPEEEEDNRSFFSANRRLLAIGRSSGNALERSYTEEFTVIPPVYIDPEAEIYTSVIGPYAAVGPGAKVENSVIRHTVIDRESQVHQTLLEMSYVGPGVEINGNFSQIQTSGAGETK